MKSKKTILFIIALFMAHAIDAQVPMSFNTEHIKAERVTPEHLRYLQTILTNPDVRKVYYNTTDETLFTDMQAQMKIITDQWESYGYGLYIIFDKNSSEFIGFAGFHSISIDEGDTINCLKGSSDVVEIYALFMPQYWRKGYGKELIVFADLYLPHKKLVAYIDPANVASLELIKKSQFKEAGRVIYNDRPHILYVYDSSAQKIMVGKQ